MPVPDADSGTGAPRALFAPAAAAGARIADPVRRPPVVCFERSTLRDVADLMVVEQVGRLLAAHAPRLRAAHHRSRARTMLRSAG